ncbi:MAG: heparinase II/III family protein [Hyphomicrobiales bacterium]
MPTATTFSDRLKLMQLNIEHQAIGLYKLATYNPLGRLRLMGSADNELFIAPQDISTTDPTRASDLYQGYYSLCGYTVNCGGQSPFEIQGQPKKWEEALHEFSWLKHLRAAETSVSRIQARTLVEDWIRVYGSLHSMTASPRIMSKRVIAWLSHSPLLLQDCDHEFYQRFMRSLTKQVRLLRSTHNKTPAGMSRMYTGIALAYASVCMGKDEKTIHSGLKRLDHELTSQILPDGGHIGRNPSNLIVIMSMLMPLRQAIISRDIVPSDVMIAAIDRIMPMLRFFRLGDGTFAKFNGMGHTPIDLVSTMLAFDDAKGTPVLNAKHSGYQRLEANRTIVVMDTGELPPQNVSGEMHAGCLSFELSDGADRMIVNCGSAANVNIQNNQSLAEIARSTAAHSTLSINEASSSRFLPEQKYNHLSGVPILSGPKKVKCDRKLHQDYTMITAKHDGYVSHFNVCHHREIQLDTTGTVLTGRDKMLHGNGTSISPDSKHSFQLRFHLDSNVAAHAGSDNTIDLKLPSGQRWLFTCENHPVELTDTINISDIYGTKPAFQILMQGSLAKTSILNWTFQRLS